MTLKKLKLRQLSELLTNKGIRTYFSHLESYTHFRKSKNQMMSRMPMPRRKKWWEKLAENQHEHFYKDAREVLPSVPKRFRHVYDVIIEDRLMHLILRIQRAVKKRSLERWL